MTGISELYNPYIRSKRERESALVMLNEAKELEAYREEQVRLGKLRKVVEYDKAQRLTKIRYVSV